MANNDLRVDTPDPTQYFVDKGPRPGTMIPRSNAEGVSLGFDHNQPQKVIVDPGMADGGFVLDLGAMRESSVFKNARVRSSSDVASFYREISQKLAEEAAQPKKEKPVSAPLKPLPEAPAEVKVELTSQINQLLQEEAAKAAAVKAHYFDQAGGFPPPQMPSSAELLLRAQLAQQAQVLNSLVERINTMQPTPAEEPPAVEPSNFASFQIPFFNGAKPERPQYEIYFEMARMGTMAARYHAVVDGTDCVALVYDTRFEDGFQYLPPNLGEEQITITVPKLKQKFTCSSLGLHWSLGCLDIVILLKHAGESV